MLFLGPPIVLIPGLKDDIAELFAQFNGGGFGGGFGGGGFGGGGGGGGRGFPGGGRSSFHF